MAALKNTCICERAGYANVLPFCEKEGSANVFMSEYADVLMSGNDLKFMTKSANDRNFRLILLL